MTNHYRQGQQPWHAKPVGRFAQRALLQSRGSLTQQLKQRYANFAVQPQRQGWYRPRPDECCSLGVAGSNRQQWVREVYLLGQGRARVFAHSVIPRAAMRGHFATLKRLGQRPLGEALFANPRIRRSTMQFAKLSIHHPWVREQLTRVPASTRQPLWARRSLFQWGQAKLMVTEVFLPEG